MRDHARKPHLRERASAILQVAAGRCGSWIAEHGLLKKRQADSIYGWLNRYEVAGIDGLHNRQGGGRPAAYEP